MGHPTHKRAVEQSQQSHWLEYKYKKIIAATQENRRTIPTITLARIQI